MTTSKADQSAPFTQFNSTLPLPQPPAPLHLSYCTKNKWGMGTFEQMGIGVAGGSHSNTIRGGGGLKHLIPIPVIWVL